jgi:hypothetical protein
MPFPAKVKVEIVYVIAHSTYGWLHHARQQRLNGAVEPLGPNGLPPPNISVWHFRLIDLTLDHVSLPRAGDVVAFFPDRDDCQLGSFEV